MAQVLKYNTPLSVCKLAAGLHQYRQRLHAESGFSETVTMLTRAFKELNAKRKEPLREISLHKLGELMVNHGKMAEKKKEDDDMEQKVCTVCP